MGKTKPLAEEALLLKKAWILAMAWLGQKVGREWLVPPNYSTWSNRELKCEIEKLQGDFGDVLKFILAESEGIQVNRIARWFAAKFDEWNQSRTPILHLGRVQDVQRDLGRLRSKHLMEFPPYAELLLQGFQSLAVRHPEYHLARDLVLLHSLFLDAEVSIEESLRQPKPISTEASQSLARSVIITCYNLLESFVSGLAVAWAMENQKPVDEITNKLPRKDRASLKERFIEVPSIIVTGKTGLLDATKPPFQPLFGDFKRRRDSFVHCEPGPQPSKYGQVKEEAFHDVQVAVVEQTVDLTLEAIRVVWKTVYGREKPHWLPERGPDGRFSRVDFRLTTQSQSPIQKSEGLPLFATQQKVVRQPKIGRNDPCPCGSGKKYKKCCAKG
jgi:SEC-C motif